MSPEEAATAKATTEEVLKEFEDWEDEVKVLIEVRMTGGLRALFGVMPESRTLTSASSAHGCPRSMVYSDAGCIANLYSGQSYTARRRSESYPSAFSTAIPDVLSGPRYVTTSRRRCRSGH